VRRGSALLALFGAIVAGAVPFLFAITAWPEVVTPSYLIARGLRLYDDIKFPHTPLLTLSVAAGSRFAGFGEGLLRGHVALTMAFTAALLVLGVRPHRRRGFTAGAFGLFAGVPLYVLLVSYTEGPALWYEPAIAPVLLGATLLLERFEIEGHASALAAAGLLLGAAVLVKQTSAWAPAAALLWLLVRSRRRNARSTLVLTASIAAPYAVFALIWAVLYRTKAHVFWTLVVPLFHPFAKEIAVRPDAAALHESIVLFFPIAAFALLRRALPARALRSPLPWVALGGFGTAWPRFGLLHFAASIGILTVLLARSALVLSVVLRRWARQGTAGRGLVPAALGTAFLLVPAGVLTLGAGPLLLDRFHGPVFFWNDATTRSSVEVLRKRVRPGGEVFVYEAPHETLYPLLRAMPPGRFYVDPVFWYCLDKDGADETVVTNLKARPGLIVLYREPTEDAVEVRRTAIYRFLASSTDIVEKVDARTSVRKVR